MDCRFSSADFSLAQRMEAAEAANGLAWARACPGGEAIPVAGGYAVFAGVDSPGTHALGIGMDGPVSDEEFDRLEDVFRSRGTPSVIDLCPMAHTTVLEQIQKRGYRVLEFNNVMARPVSAGEPLAEAVMVDRAPDPIEWTTVVARGFLDRDEIPDDYIRMVSSAFAMGDCLLARINDEPAGGAAMGVRDRVALLYGDSTLVQARGRGVQRALIKPGSHKRSPPDAIWPWLPWCQARPRTAITNAPDFS